jgi:hypothetical protein
MPLHSAERSRSRRAPDWCSRLRVGADAVKHGLTDRQIKILTLARDAGRLHQMDGFMIQHRQVLQLSRLGLVTFTQEGGSLRSNLYAWEAKITPAGRLRLVQELRALQRQSKAHE